MRISSKRTTQKAALQTPQRRMLRRRHNQTETLPHIGRFPGLNSENETRDRRHDGRVHHAGEQDDASDGVWPRPKSVLVVFYL